MKIHPYLLAMALAGLLVAWTPPAPTKATGCHVNGLLPDVSCTPGAVATTDMQIVCGTSTRGRRNVTEAERRAVFVAYGLSPRQPEGAFEVDHLVSLELGGSNALANLWPEAAPGFHDKDRVEDDLHRRVCSGAMSLDEAQRAIAADWTGLR
jgi:hypothetical protein